MRARAHTHTHTHTHTLAPSILPLLEALAEGFFWDLPEFGRSILFDALHGCETCPLAEKSIPFIIQTPYSADLVPSDFWLFPTMKMGLKATHFSNMQDIKSNSTAELRKIPKKLSAGASNIDRIDGASMGVRKGPTLKVIR